MKRAVIIAAFLMSGVAFGQTPTPVSKYVPTENQNLKLKLAQDEAKLSQQNVQNLNSQLQAAQIDFSGKLKDLSDTCKSVSKENGWPSTVVCDFDKLTFAEAPKAPEKAESKTEVKPTPSK